MPFKSYKEASRTNWGKECLPGEGLTIEQINCGALLRVADSCESMARNHDQLQRRAEWAESRMKDLQANVDQLRHSNAALRGHLNRIKRSR